MHKGRLEAFSDGVLAIIITIMVLELKAPHNAPSITDLKTVWPTFLSYMISFIYIGIYWNNHHHLFQITPRVDGRILWANLQLLFWLSLVPFTTAWVGDNHFAPTPTALYGAVLLMAAVAFTLLQISILRMPGGNPTLAKAIGRDRKGKLSLALYASAIPLSFLSQWIGCGIYVLVALIWLIPDARIEHTLLKQPQHHE